MSKNTGRPENEEAYRLLTESMADVAQVISLDGRFLAVNRRASEFSGYSRDQLLSMGPADIDSTLTLKDVQRLLAEVDSNGPRVIETGHCAADGRIVPVEIALSAVSYMGERAVLAIARDITQRKQVEESLRALTRRNLAILQTIPDIIAEVDESKVYTWVNDAGLEFFGDGVVGREAAYYCTDEAATYEAVRPLFDGDPETRYVESWQRRQDGQDRLLVWWCRALRDDSGQMVGALSTGRDITEKWLIEAMRDARLRLLDLAPSATVREFLQAALRELQRFTNSPIAFCNFLAQGEEGNSSAASWEALALDDSSAIDPERLHVLSDEGVWAECLGQGQPLIRNDYQAPPERKGLQAEDDPVFRVLTVPVFRDDKVVAVFGLGNKPSPYTEHDVAIVSTFADQTWDTVARKQAEAALQESNARNRRFFDSSPNAVFLSDPDGHFLDCNRTATEIYGYTREEFLTMRYRDLAAVELRDKAGAHVGETLERGGTVFEWRHRRKDGTELPVEIRTSPFVAQGKHRILATVRDLTASKAAEEALLQSEERFRSLASMTTEGIMIHEQGVIVDANRAFAELVGYHDGDELVGKKGLDVLPATEESRRELISHLRSADSATFAIELVMPDESRVWAETRGREVMYRGRPARLVFMRDITERKRAEEALRRSEQEFRALFEAAPVGIGVADIQGNILAFNGAILRPGGYTHDDIQRIGNVSALYYDAEERETALTLFLAQGSLHQHEVRFKRKDGTPYDVWLSLTHTTFNGVSCIQAIVEDRTEKQRAEEEQERLQTQLRQAAKMESIGRLAGGVAHDYNNMLAVILGHVQLALEQVSPDDALYADLLEIKEAADRSAGITQQLLAFARRQVTIPRVIDLNKAVQGMMGMLGRLIGEQVRLTWIPGKDIGRVQMDPAQLDQLLVNLCLNARDAIVDAGKVVIRTADVTLDEQYCAEHEGCVPGNYTRLSVSDNGTGMSPEALEHLFEPFFTTKDTGKGTGLGLATVYGIVRQNAGFIQVESGEAIGTQVHIYLPRVDAEATAEDHELIPTAAPRGTETLLVVEDEPSVLRLTQRILVDLGYQVLTAPQPSDALRIAQKHTDIAMVITDIVMPDMNGRELSERLRALRPGLKVLYVSGYTDEVPLADVAVQEGVDFLQKPFTLQSLATAVRTILDRD